MSFLPKRYYIDDFFDDFVPSVDKYMKAGQMKCDIYEKDGKYNIEIDIPGYDKEDISIEVDNGVLTVSASKTNEEKDEGKNYIRRERYSGTFSRSFTLGSDVDMDNIDAEFVKGMLKITVPKMEEKSSKKTIDIK
jgi:HSP20 family molecular chaperone IbpA